MQTNKQQQTVDVLAVLDAVAEFMPEGRAKVTREARAAVAELIAALREVLKHEKWHAAMADEVTDEAKASIARADAALARIGGAA